VPDNAQIAASIRDIIVTNWPHRFARGELHGDVSLGEDGLGLDSVEIVELLVACEQRCGVYATEELFAVVPLTIERVADHLAVV
jgi:acyl carrier protein